MPGRPGMKGTQMKRISSELAICIDSLANEMNISKTEASKILAQPRPVVMVKKKKKEPMVIAAWGMGDLRL